MTTFLFDAAERLARVIGRALSEQALRLFVSNTDNSF